MDQRQRIVNASDALKETLGGSWSIESTQSAAENILKEHKDVKEIKVASGDIWLCCDDLKKLMACLGDFRAEIVDSLNLPCSFAVIRELATPEESRKELTDRIRRIKDGKSGETAHISLPWFAPCKIQPDQYANVWYATEDDKKRNLVSLDSDTRASIGQASMASYYWNHEDLAKYNLKHPYQMDHLAASGDGKVLALLRLDADNAGTFFKELVLGTAEDSNRWNALKNCSRAFEEILRKSFEQAIRETIEDGITSKILTLNKDYFPISPLIHAGDDLLLVIRREMALDFACKLVKLHKTMAAECKILTNRMKLTDDQNMESGYLTLSGSIVFARSGFPFSVLSKISEQMERSAKSHRKQPYQIEPCLDIYWLESTGREDPCEGRDRALTYRVSTGDGDFTTYSLCSLPWTLSQAAEMSHCARLIKDAKIPRGKWHQLLAGLREGEPRGSLAYCRWLQHLESIQRKRMNEVTERLSRQGLWDRSSAPWVEVADGSDGASKYVTPLLELHQLREMLNTGQATSEDATRL